MHPECTWAILSAVLVGLCLAGPVAAAVSGEIVAVPRPATQRVNRHYISHRPPLRPNPLLKLPIGSIEPRGWLRQQLVLSKGGLTGRLAELSAFLNKENNAWLSPRGEGENGWEEVPYWLKGFGDLAYVLRDESLKREARTWIDAILSSQDADGYFGPRENRAKKDAWPNMVALNVLQSFHEATGDPRVLPFMTRYFRWQLALPDDAFLPGSWQKVRAGDNLESVHWLYNRTGDAWLLDLGTRLHRGCVRWDEGIANWHGVNICQGFREPAVYWVQSGDRRHLDATERVYEAVMALYGRAPGGMFAADEDCRPGHHGPSQGAETCSMVEFMHSFQMLLKFTGDAVYADRCEEVAFNSLPAALTPNLRGLHYVTSPNMVQLDRRNHAPGIENEGVMLAFDPHLYRCCQHNVAMGWPYYAEHLWLATPDDGLAAVLYAASEVRATVAAEAEVVITEETDYPFDESITLKIATPRPVTFPLYLRVPGWCRRAELAVNGKPQPVDAPPLSYLRIERTWVDGDVVRLALPMHLHLTRWRTNANSLSVHRGPLTYSLRIGEEWVRNGGTDAWPAYDVLPKSPWNYGLVVDERKPDDSFQVLRRPGPLAAQPFDASTAPIELKARGKRIADWTLDEHGLAASPPASPVRCDAPLEELTLIPMGSARLRITAFPTIGEGPNAEPPPAASQPRP